MSRLWGAVALVSAFSASASAFEPWAGAGFERARARAVEEREIYPAGRPVHRYRLALTLVELDGTNWTEARVLSHVRRTAAILGACDISLDNVTYAKARAPRGAHDLDIQDLHPAAPLPKQVIDLPGRVPASAPWPVVFFVGRLIGDQAFARSYRRGEVPVDDLPRYPYMNSVWIGYRTHWMERKEEAYSTLAHELGHVLCECGHKPDLEQRHLLNGYKNLLGAQPLAEHCEMFRGSPLVTPVDERQARVSP